MPRAALAAALPAVLARRDLAAAGAARPRGLGDRLAVLPRRRPAGSDRAWGRGATGAAPAARRFSLKSARR